MAGTPQGEAAAQVDVGGFGWLMGRVAGIAARLDASHQARPVRAAVAPTAARDQLALADEGLPLDAVLDDLEALFSAAPTTASGRFWNQLFAGCEPIATAADMLACVGNHSLYTYKVAGPLVVAEQLVLERMLQRCGFAAGDGVLCPGGSLSNLCALLLARGEALPEARNLGFDGRRCRVYASAEAHYSLPKAALIAGLGRSHCRSVACDRDGRLDPSALEATLAEDAAAGLLPLMVVATAGTTVRGAFDPIAAMADVCAARGVWLHVDAAFGGALLLSPQSRGALAGIERADSVTWDAHKAMGVPLLCSALLVRRRGLLARHLGEHADYLFQADDDRWNPGTRSIQCGRRNDGLKLWALWRHLGDAGMAERVERQLSAARLLAAKVSAHPHLQLVEPPPSLTVCVRTVGADAAAVCDLLAATRAHLVGHGDVRGERVVRVAVIDPARGDADLDALLYDLSAATKAVAGPPAGGGA